VSAFVLRVAIQSRVPVQGIWSVFTGVPSVSTLSTARRNRINPASVRLHEFGSFATTSTGVPTRTYVPSAAV